MFILSLKKIKSDMARLAVLLAVLGGFAYLFTNWAIVIELVALVMAVIAMIKNFKQKMWAYALLLSLFYIIVPLWLFLKNRSLNLIEPQWSYMPSAQQFYFDPNYSQKQDNFNFDSLMTNEDPGKVKPMITQDTAVGPDDAPLD